MRTVQDFMESILPIGTSAEGVQEFFRGRMDRRVFWSKLCTLGCEKRTKNSDETNDVYATAPLTDAEWMELQTEFNRIKTRVEELEMKHPKRWMIKALIRNELQNDELAQKVLSHVLCCSECVLIADQYWLRYHFGQKRRRK